MQQWTYFESQPTSSGKFWMYSNTPPNTAVSIWQLLRSGRGRELRSHTKVSALRATRSKARYVQSGVRYFWSVRLPAPKSSMWELGCTSRASRRVRSSHSGKSSRASLHRLISEWPPNRQISQRTIIGRGIGYPRSTGAPAARKRVRRQPRWLVVAAARILIVQLGGMKRSTKNGVRSAVAPYKNLPFPSGDCNTHHQTDAPVPRTSTGNNHSQRARPRESLVPARTHPRDSSR